LLKMDSAVIGLEKNDINLEAFHPNAAVIASGEKEP
jgi:hypothetical protein